MGEQTPSTAVGQKYSLTEEEEEEEQQTLHLKKKREKQSEIRDQSEGQRQAQSVREAVEDRSLWVGEEESEGRRPESNSVCEVINTVVLQVG